MIRLARNAPAGRLALLALAAAILLGATAALLPRASVDAQNREWFGRWYAKVGDTAICPNQDSVQRTAGAYSWTRATSITLYLRAWGIGNCGPANVVAKNVQDIRGAVYRDQWYLELRDAPGSDGSLIAGAHIYLPDDFSDRRTLGTFNRRDQTVDGHWPTETTATSEENALPVEISFTVPDSHSGPAYLHAGIYFNEQDENTDVWEDFTFQFSRPPGTVTPTQCVNTYGDGTYLTDRYFARARGSTKPDSDRLVSQIPQADRITDEGRECAQIFQDLKHPGLSWSETTTCRILDLISLRRTGVEERQPDGIYIQLQRVATSECRYVQTPAMDDGSTPPEDLIPPSEPRTVLTAPSSAYFWLCWRECT